MKILKTFAIKYLRKDMDLKQKLSKLRRNFYLEFYKTLKKIKEQQTSSDSLASTTIDIMKKF